MTILTWPEHSLFPYERGLAERELRILADPSREVVVSAHEASAELDTKALTQLTYFASWRQGDVHVPLLQRQVEMSHLALRGRGANRQATRFLVHDLHEYKGKFNPQMARALINIWAPKATTIVDPYCGSGTTVVEALRLGRDAFGSDLSPFAAWVSTLKIDLLRSPRIGLVLEQYAKVSAEIIAQNGAGKGRLRNYDEAALRYLESWFPAPSLSLVRRTLGAVDESDPLIRRLVEAAVSRVARDLSLQLPEDLRVRRRQPGWVHPDPVSAVAAALDHVGRVLLELARAPSGAIPLRGHASIATTGAAEIHTFMPPRLPSESRAIVTSPPYATALPYIDTDRLSLVLLGLTSPRDLRVVEAGLTGSREWSPGSQRDWLGRYKENLDRLPPAVGAVTSSIERLNEATSAGFRRRAVPALLYRYFAEMRQSLVAWNDWLLPGERSVLVVGTNRTGGASGLTIDTPVLIAEVARDVGYEVEEVVPFETWPRYQIHSKNGVPSESAVVLRRT